LFSLSFSRDVSIARLLHRDPEALPCTSSGIEKFQCLLGSQF
jgi:hypothetical protein